MKVAIAGAGKLGFKVASALAGGDYSITIIDIKESVLDKISQQLDVMTVKADARKVSVLQDVGISGFDYLIASTGTDEINILVASFAKKLGCRQLAQHAHLTVLTHIKLADKAAFNHSQR